MRITKIVRGTWGLAAIGVLALVGAPAAAAADDPPDDVAGWFTSEAAAVVEEAQQTAVTADGQPAMDFVEVQVGSPVTLTTWTEDYIAGLEGAAVAAPMDRWIAPMTSGSETVGTVTATRTTGGVVELAFFDDNASLARGLLSLPSDASVVYDAPLDAYFTVTGDVVAPMSDNSRSELAARTTAEPFQDQLAARYADEGGTDLTGLPETDPRRAMAGGGATVPTGAREQASGLRTADWITVAGALIAAGGAVVLVRQRRAASRP